MKVVKAAELNSNGWEVPKKSGLLELPGFLSRHPRILKIITEFIRYAVVGGAAFVIDYSLFSVGLSANLNYMTATVMGFLAGLFTNYMLCIFWVWKGTSARTLKDLLVFSAIGIVGLFLTALLMWISVSLLNFDAHISKLFITALVLVWNFGLRRVFVFFR